jgi:2-polyprenyl-6-methoxyphenol hydroxylase-like FAD-dependent oxidoreductase
MSEQTVLICGAGIAGPTLAYWLAQHGWRPTLVEHAVAPRSSGAPVDVRGRAVEVAERMGVMPRIRQAGTHTIGISFVNATGRRVGGVNLRALQQAAGSREVELPRGDLASILYQASRDHAEFLFNDTIVALDQDEHGVGVTFDRAQPRRFDLVIGADGLHSAVRRLAFGPESGFVRHMGIYVATTRLDGSVGGGREVVMYNTPAGRSRSTPRAATPWRSSPSAARPCRTSTTATPASTSGCWPPRSPTPAGRCPSCCGACRPPMTSTSTPSARCG